MTRPLLLLYKMILLLLLLVTITGTVVMFYQAIGVSDLFQLLILFWIFCLSSHSFSTIGCGQDKVLTKSDLRNKD